MGNVPLIGGSTGRALLAVAVAASVRLWELIVDTDKKELLFNDGVTAGGFPVSTPVPFVFSKSGAAVSGFLNGGDGVVTSNTHGYRIPFAAEVVHISYEGTAWAAARIQLARDATNLAVITGINADGTTSTGFLSTITANSVLNLTISAGNVDNPLIVVWIRRTAI